MDTDLWSVSNMGMWSEDDFFGCDQLQEDTEDSDGKLILIEYIYLLIWLFA